MVDGRGVRASLKAGADPGQRLDGVTVAAAVGTDIGDVIATGCAANSSATATAEAIAVTARAAMTARHSVLFTPRWCDADWGRWLGKRDDRDLVSDDAERGTGGTGLGDRLRCGRLCGCQWAGLLGRFDTDADSEPGCQRASIRDRLGAREHITADPLGHHIGRTRRSHHARDTHDRPG